MLLVRQQKEEKSSENPSLAIPKSSPLEAFEDQAWHKFWNNSLVKEKLKVESCCSMSPFAQQLQHFDHDCYRFVSFSSGQV